MLRVVHRLNGKAHIGLVECAALELVEPSPDELRLLAGRVAMHSALLREDADVHARDAGPSLDDAFSELPIGDVPGDGDDRIGDERSERFRPFVVLRPSGAAGATARARKGTRGEADDEQRVSTRVHRAYSPANNAGPRSALLVALEARGAAAPGSLLVLREAVGLAAVAVAEGEAQRALD